MFPWMLCRACYRNMGRYKENYPQVDPWKQFKIQVPKVQKHSKIPRFPKIQIYKDFFHQHVVLLACICWNRVWIGIFQKPTDSIIFLCGAFKTIQTTCKCHAPFPRKIETLSDMKNILTIDHHLPDKKKTTSRSSKN